ncbi:MAG TPA: ABC transporter ATP-binding protein [Gaiellaceae bacterium]|nr:ABC transporter ATP-binding protein [Gaiellaceae bacterium]
MSPEGGNGTAPVLEVVDLVKHYPIAHSRAFVAAVNGVSFTIGKGETLGLVGESGSGKSTVARCVLNLTALTRGRILFDGRDISRLGAAEARALRRRIQLVFQEPFDSLNPRMTIGSAIAEPLVVRKVEKAERRRRVAELRDLVHLPESVLDLYPHEISGGLQQRVGIARAIATNPTLLVLDEPTSALDPRARRQIIDLLIELQRELEMSYLFITHDLNTLRHISHRIAVMYLGLIVEEGPTQAIFEEQRHPYTRALLSSVLYPDPETRRARFELRGEIPSPIDLPLGCYLASRCPLVVDECRAGIPPLLAIGDGRTSACIRHELVPNAREAETAA